MSFYSSFSGNQIDNVLGKFLDLELLTTGTVRLTSSTSVPTNLANLRGTGSFITDCYIDGPSGLNTFPLHIIVSNKDGTLFQTIYTHEYKYVRELLPDAGNYGSWELSQSEGVISVSETAPLAPISGKTFWLDTSVTPSTLKMYYEGAWIVAMSANSMAKAVYDPTGIETDLYEYIDSAVAASNDPTIELDFTTHIENSSIHVTPEDKERIDNLVNQTELDAAAQTAIDSITEIINSKLQYNSTVTAITTAINTLIDTMTAHKNNDAIHPDSDKIEEWDSKAEGDHGHDCDDNVYVKAENIVGKFELDNLPYHVVQNAVVVKSLAELLALEKDPHHNGDTILHITDDSDVINWYFIVDDDKMGTMDAFRTVSYTSKISFENVLNTPTTAEGYGLTDVITVDRLDEITALVDGAKETLGTVPDMPQLADTNNLQSVSEKMELLLQLFTADDNHNATDVTNALLDKIADFVGTTQKTDDPVE